MIFGKKKTKTEKNLFYETDSDSFPEKNNPGKKKPADRDADSDDEVSDFYTAGDSDGKGKASAKPSASSSFYKRDNDDELARIPKDRPWLLSLEWWEYLILAVETGLVVYAFLVIIGIAPLW